MKLTVIVGDGTTHSIEVEDLTGSALVLREGERGWGWFVQEADGPWSFQVGRRKDWAAALGDALRHLYELDANDRAALAGFRAAIGLTDGGRS